MTAYLVDETNEQYHSRKKALGSSMMRTFIRSPMRFNAQERLQTIPESAPALEQDIGSAAHAFILEPHTANETVVKIPDDVLAKNGAKLGNKWKDFERENRGKILLKHEDYGKALGLSAAAFDCEEFAEMYGNATHKEQSIYWECPRTGLLKKCRTDLIGEDECGLYVIDIKTLDDYMPRSFSSSCERFLYHVQQEFYRDGVEAYFGERPQFYFLAIQRKLPYAARMYELGKVQEGRNRTVELANDILHKGEQDYLSCLQRDEWKDQGADEITTIEFHEYAYRNDWEVTYESDDTE